MKNIGKIIFPSVLIILGAILLFFAYTGEQNWQFKLASFGIMISGLTFLLNVFEMLKKTIRLALFAVLVIFALGLTYLDYKSIKEPIDFMNEKKHRYAMVVQRLKDVRVAQLTYKAVKGKFASDFDGLMNFIKHDSLPVIKAIGTVPDTLTEEQALKMGLVRRDTSYVPAKDSIFSSTYLNARGTDFQVDSLPYVPYGNGAKFKLNSGQIERNKVNVQVIEVVAGKKIILDGLDAVLISREDDLKFGSMTDPNTNGNWGE